MARSRRMKKQKLRNCNCPSCHNAYAVIAGKISAMIIALVALILIFDKAHSYMIIPVVAVMAILGIVVASLQYKSCK